MFAQCPSCGGNCGRTAKNGCQYVAAVSAQEQLAWLLNELREREDVRDGGDGQQLPNEAMAVLAEFNRRFN